MIVFIPFFPPKQPVWENEPNNLDYKSVLTSSLFFTKFLVVIVFLLIYKKNVWIQSWLKAKDYLSLFSPWMTQGRYHLNKDRENVLQHITVNITVMQGVDVLRHEDHAVLMTDTDFVSGEDAVFASFHSFVLWKHIFEF